MFRTSLSIDDKTSELVKQAATAQNRTISGQLRHLIKSHPEIIGLQVWNSHPGLKAAIVAAGKDIGND